MNRAADNNRILAAAMVEKAKSGHPGGAMGGADFINVLYSEYMQFDPQNPTWEGRDRFFLDPGHMSPMLYETTRKKKLKSNYRAVSLDQKIPGTNCSYGDTAADSFDLEEVVISGLRMKMLLEELKQWNPWAVDLFELYTCGMKTEATFILSRRYGTTIRTVQRWKEQFEKYVKVFFEEN